MADSQVEFGEQEGPEMAVGPTTLPALPLYFPRDWIWLDWFCPQGLHLLPKTQPHGWNNPARALRDTDSPGFCFFAF